MGGKVKHRLLARCAWTQVRLKCTNPVFPRHPAPPDPGQQKQKTQYTYADLVIMEVSTLRSEKSFMHVMWCAVIRGERGLSTQPNTTPRATLVTSSLRLT